jgi:hypothetical protein
MFDMHIAEREAIFLGAMTGMIYFLFVLWITNRKGDK